MALQVVTPPATEPLSPDEAKLHLRVTNTVEDALITALIIAARQDAEMFTARAFITQALKLTLDRFPCGAITLLRPPLISVTSVKYTDTAGVERTLVANTDYQVDIASQPGRVLPAPGRSWPSTQSGAVGAVRVEYSAGYGALAAAVPEPIKAAMKLMIGHLFVNRSSVITGTIVSACPQAVERLLTPYRILTVI